MRWRLLARTAAPARRLQLSLCEARALLWEGELARAVAVVDRRLLGASEPALGVGPVVVKLEALVFDERWTEARALFTSREGELRGAAEHRAHVVALSGFLRFHDGDPEGARAELEAALSVARARDPILPMVRFVLAAIAHAEGRRDDTRRYLWEAASGAGGSFVARWAAAQWETVFPEYAPVPVLARAPRTSRRGRAFRDLGEDLRTGLGVAFLLRTSTLRGRAYTLDRVAALLAFDAVLVVALRAVDWTRDAEIYESSALVLVAPLLFFLIPAYVATRRLDRAIMLRLVAGFHAALPPILLLAFVGTRSAHESVWPGAVELIAGAWALLVALRLIVSLAWSAGALSILSSVVLFVVAWLVPMQRVGTSRLFFVRTWSLEQYEEDKRLHDDRVFAQADRVIAAETALLEGRRGVTDLYFVGAAGWADQDVFRREVLSARALLDDRFDTRGRSIVLANDAASQAELPLAAPVGLRHVLRTVGERMNRDEDILFLFATSHGSSDGLALRFPRGSAFEDQSLSPAELRSMLDAAGIKWRVIVIAGCDSGVFVAPLRNENTLLTTAAAADRSSYGCAMGNAFTDFGRAIFAEQLVHERSFPVAFANAAASVEQAEKADGRVLSRPQIAVGEAIQQKLRQLEEQAVVQSLP